ncbi:cupin domain-containing protein [Streptomyces litchfieldiae]|uniref:Zf-HC2 domain-containing protein n=1 Tax=Streptomyces litchfieldiae TaxID=3075543 RepID=A0ABU2MVU3_9ACTN|nr:zf-HC2 domain-containing protein [Streptomyces sp. DSM 44938]MDT0344963.1 zf-HC2 domain-containing protein [Streptomyces sp. DSM 44938]
MTSHMSKDELRAYAASELPPPWLWSVDAHLARCAECRTALRALTDPAELDAGWARLDAELDAPHGSRAESLLVRAGVPDHTARLLAATPVLRTSWFVAVVVTLSLGVVVGRAATPLLLLSTAPLLPLAGVAISFGPALDPTHEMAVVAPLHTFRLLLVRTAAVLATTVPAAMVASLVMPTSGVVMAGWPLPALALTSLGLSLMPRLGPVAAPVLVGCGWVTVLLICRPLTQGPPFPLTGVGQLAALAVALVATVTLMAGRDRFDSGRHLNASFPGTARRLS